MPATSVAVVLVAPEMSTGAGGGGGGVTVSVFISVPTSRRPPVTVMPVREEVAATLDSSAVRICAAVASECVEAYSATAPVTCGAAIEVPLYEPYFSPGKVEWIDDPGAARSTVVTP